MLDFDFIDWDEDDDRDRKRLPHRHSGLTTDGVASVTLAQRGRDSNRSSNRPAVFRWTNTNRYIGDHEITKGRDAVIRRTAYGQRRPVNLGRSFPPEATNELRQRRNKQAWEDDSQQQAAVMRIKERHATPGTERRKRESEKRSGRRFRRSFPRRISSVPCGFAARTQAARVNLGELSNRTGVDRRH